MREEVYYWETRLTRTGIQIYISLYLESLKIQMRLTLRVDKKMYQTGSGVGREWYRMRMVLDENGIRRGEVTFI